MSSAADTPRRSRACNSRTFDKLDLARLPTPCFVVDEVAIERNLKILSELADASGATVLSALKAFSMWRLAPLISSYLSGTCASGLHEARLGRECYGGEVHVFSAAYTRGRSARDSGDRRPRGV